MISVFDLFKIGVGPSSSHTVGPMRAAAAFAAGLVDRDIRHRVRHLGVTLYGSLAWTGEGHGTDRAVLAGLSGAAPETVDPDRVTTILSTVTDAKQVALAGGPPVAFDPARDLIFDRDHVEARHPNALRLTAIGDQGEPLSDELWFSVGGGFVVRDGDAAGDGDDDIAKPPHPFASAADLLRIGRDTGLSIAEIMMANEAAWRPEPTVRDHLNRVAETMMTCIDRGCTTEAVLPGGLDVPRRAPALARRLAQDRHRNTKPPHEIMDHVSLFAIAVNEENAAGGRVVTAPTNGAAGIIPAVLRYARDFCAEVATGTVEDFLLTAAAVGALCKMNASISGAEMGCQGEVGVACSMAAAGLTALLGGTNEQIENAAEIGIEHNLGLTCDPVGGLVQIPCIERNAFGAVKAVNAASLALKGDGTHKISLDQVIETMRQTGLDMQSKYKETSLGGLAVNYIEC